MVEVTARARWFARGAARGTGVTRTPFFEDRGVSRARSDQWSFASEEAVDRSYLRDGLFVLGVVAAGLLLARRSMRGGASLSPSSDAGETRADATDRTVSEPAGVPDPPSGPTEGSADGPGGGPPALSRAAPQDAVPPTTPSSEPPGPEVSTGRPAEDLDRAPADGVPSGLSAGTPSADGATTAEEPPAAQEPEQPPAEEAPRIAEELPPPPQASEVQLPPPPQTTDVELPPPPSTPDVAEELPSTPPEEAAGILEELPPPPEVAEAELPPPPPAPENIIDELPPPPVPEEQNVGEVTPAPPEPSVEPVVEAPRTEEPRDRRRVTATSAARRRARELGVDLFEVEGTGKNGKITVDDVQRSGEQTQS